MSTFSHLYLYMPYDPVYDMARYWKALLSEMKRPDRAFNAAYLDSIYVAGAFDCWSESQVLDTSGTLVDMFVFDSNTEFTIEITGKSGTSSQYLLWQKSGVNRISIGSTHFKDIMRTEGFASTLKEYTARISLAHSFFDNINVDIDMSLVGTFFHWKKLIMHISDSPITHISLYAHDAVLDVPVSWYEWAMAFLSSCGFEQYEFSHFAKSGYRSRYLQACWDHVPYRGFGAGACSFDGKNRFCDEPDIETYVERSMQDRSPIVFHETLTEKEMRLEKLLVGLRRKEGVLLCDATKNLSPIQKESFLNKVAALKKKKLIREHDGRLVLTVHGMMLENQVLIDLIIE